MHCDDDDVARSSSQDNATEQAMSAASEGRMMQLAGSGEGQGDTEDAGGEGVPSELEADAICDRIEGTHL